jgi:hypothetical protein
MGAAGGADASPSDGSSADDGSVSDEPVSGDAGPGGDDSGPPPAAVLSSSTVDLGNLSCGEAGTASLTIDNTGLGDLAVSASVTGQDFSLSPSALSVAPGKSGTLTLTTSVAAQAAAGSVVTETLLLFTNDPAHASVSVPVTVTPTGATVQIAPGSPTSVSFRPTEPGVTPPPISVALVNSGNAPAAVGIGPPSDPEFTFYGYGPDGGTTMLAPGDTLTVITGFKPSEYTTTATASSLVTVSGVTCGTSISSIAFSGSVGHGIVTRWPTSLDFGPAKCGGAAPDYKYVVLGNAGATNATITSATVTGAAFATNAKGLVIPAGVTASFAVFPPPVPSGSTLDPVAGTLTVLTDADSSPHAMTLTEQPYGNDCATDAGTEGGP